jgi:hypothetical protein
MEKSLAERVDALALDSMYRGPHEATEDVIRKEGVKVECVVHTFFFHPERVRANKDAIAAVIAEMDPVFNKFPAGGASFLQLCMDKNGYQWGEHYNCEMLIALAIATKQGGWCFPRGMWNILPGGMPYVWLGEGEKPAEAA